MTVVSVPKILRDKLTDAGADALVQIIDKVEDRSQKVVLEMAEERFEKQVAQVESKLESKIAETSAALETKIAQTESRLETKIAESKTELSAAISQLRVDIAQSKTETIRWTSAFVMGQFWAIVGTLFVFFRK